MVILILIILLFFKLYVKSITNNHLTIILIVVFVLYEGYYYKEHFQADVEPNPSSRTNASDEEVYLDTNFLDHKRKQECIYENQKRIVEDYDIDSFSSVCYKIKDLKQCNKTLNCNYDNELNKCIDVNIDCDTEYKDISNIKCHYLDTEEKCNNLNIKLTDCNKKNEMHCESSPQCYFDYSTNKCEFKKETCIGATKDECDKNKNCLYKYYSDVYNISIDTNLKECHDFTKFLEFNSHFIEAVIPNITLDEFEKLLNDNYKNVKYYGYRIDSENKSAVYILNMSNLLLLSRDSKISLLEGLTKDKFIGNDNSLVIFEKKGNCVNNKKVCKWQNISSFNCGNISNKDDCNNDETCYFEDDKCKNKGFCYNKCEFSDSKDVCESQINLKNEKLCFWDNKNQKCLNNECLYNKEKC